jgi:hypothetical protein
MMRASFACFAGLLMVAAVAPGCIGGGDDVADEADVSTDALSLTGWESLAGAWVGASGPFQGLVITRTVQGQGRHFFADADTGVRCITTPCASQAHLEGRVTAGTRNLTLRHPDRPSADAAPFYGTYAYTLNGATLTLAQGGRIVARLRKATSYCSDADQCAEQRLVTPRCLGRFECESNACRYRCGVAPQPTCATTRCAAGTICVEGDAGPRCITACATVRCTASTVCVADASGARCVPRTCANTETACAAGEVCVDGDAGPTCITRCATVRCAAGTTCVADAAGVRCELAAGACASDADCQLSDNYCGGCACDALGHGQRPVTCASPVACFRQPCAGLVARCDTAAHRCQAVSAPAGVRCGSATCGAGLVCCNPLRGICTAPGMFCIQ